MRRSVALAAALVMAAGSATGAAGTGAGGDRGRHTDGAVVTVSAAELAQAGRLMLIDLPFASVDPVTRLLVGRDQIGGVVLFGRNVGTPAQVRALDSTLHRLAGSRGFVITTDQEGGAVRRLAGVQPVLSAAAEGRRGATAVRAVMRQAGQQLAALGIDIDLAPVADRAGGFLGTRSYGTSPAPLVAAAVTGLQSGGVGATAKHFPGLGGVAVSTDEAVARGSAVTAASLAPFVAAVHAHVRLVMVDLAVHPGLGPQPAALEPATYALLRGPRVGFTGPAVTDALDAAAVSREGEVQAAVAAVAAGADLVLVPGGPLVDQEVLSALVAAVRSGRIPSGRYLQALARATALERGTAG